MRSNGNGVYKTASYITRPSKSNVICFLRQQLDFAKNDNEQLQQSLKLTEEQQTSPNAKLKVCIPRLLVQNWMNVFNFFFGKLEEIIRGE